MPINYSIQNIEKDLAQMSANVEAIDMESVKRRTLKRVADEMSKLVRQAVVDEPSITTPALNSPYKQGPGPSMSRHDAWMVEKTGANRYSVFPHPEVRQRAMVLNFGYPGMIRPTNSEFLRFTVDGTPVYAEEVEGPEYTGYWQAAYRKLQNSNKLEEIAGQELQAEFEEKF